MEKRKDIPEIKDKKKILLVLDEELHKKIKLISVENNVSMRHLIIKWLKEKASEI